MGHESFFHLHAHSRYSWLDGMPRIGEMVDRAVKHEQPALAVTDHGVMSGAVRLYKKCSEAGIAPFIGIEAYLVLSLEKKDHPYNARHHVGLLALDYEGYRALVELNTLSHDDEHFYRKPRITLKELLEFGNAYGKHVALTTGCFFGLPIQTLIASGKSPAKQVVINYAKAFPNTFVELQHHNTVHPNGVTDYEIVTSMYEIASSLGLPVVIAQDAHYCDKSHKSVHEMMKRLGYHVSDDSEILFPGDSYHLASTQEMKKKFFGLKHVWQEADNAFDFLLEKNRLVLPALEKYRFNVPKLVKDADSDLLLRVMDVLDRGTDAWVTPEYMDRIQYELEIIKQLKFADYFIFVSDVIQWCDKRGIIVNARGSVNGSLVCFLLGVTYIDPIKWGISFDRFLHPSRKKPPDIDLDIERDRRDEVIEYLNKRYQVVPIGTYGRLTDVNDRGAVFQKYLGWKRRQLGDEKYKSSEFARIQMLRELEDIVPEDTKMLRKLAKMDVFTGGGTHAAGYVLTTKTQPISDYIPLMRVGGQRGHLVSQFDDDDVEELGYVKFDALGLAALTTAKRCLELIGRSDDGLGWIPDDDKETLESLSKGRTDTGVFQFEGYSTADGARKMKLKSTQDCVYCLALFRPASLDSGNTEEYLLRRKKKKPVTYVHSSFEKHTKSTYGVFVLQDQVIDVLREVGMDYEDLNDMLKAVKASNYNIIAAEKTFARLHGEFVKKCQAIGMRPTQAEAAWKEIRGFSDYGFNKAHATSYGVLGYRMAYLKQHYPMEFMAATLETWSGTDKEIKYVGEARRIGIRIGRVDVNKSNVRWAIDPQDNNILRRGLLSVKGVGEKAAAEIVRNQPFDSVEDLIECCDGSTGMVTGGREWRKTGELKGVLKALQDSGALNSLLEQ